jgi:hypothetical protein
VGSGYFDFNGAYFLGAGIGSVNASPSITVVGYRDGVLVGSADTSLSIDGFTWLAANISGVNQLEFDVPGSNYAFLMDNFTYNAGDPVPEPCTLLLVGFGLVGLTAYRKKFSNY